MHISMPINEVQVIRSCKECNTEIETISVKKDNMRLITEDLTGVPLVTKTLMRSGISREEQTQ